MIPRSAPSPARSMARSCSPKHLTISQGEPDTAHAEERILFHLISSTQQLVTADVRCAQQHGAIGGRLDHSAIDPILLFLTKKVIPNDEGKLAAVQANPFGSLSSRLSRVFVQVDVRQDLDPDAVNRSGGTSSVRLGSGGLRADRTPVSLQQGLGGTDIQLRVGGVQKDRSSFFQFQAPGGPA